MAMKVRYTTIEGEVIAEKRSGVRKHYVPDPLGSTVALLDSTQTPTDTFAYWPYGEEAAHTGSTPTPFRFVGTQGYYKDSATRTYVRARHLDTGKARWLTPDPIGFEGGDWNLYRYVKNMPPSRFDASGLYDPFDPSGHCEWSCYKTGSHAGCYCTASNAQCEGGQNTNVNPDTIGSKNMGDLLATTLKKGALSCLTFGGKPIQSVAGAKEKLAQVLACVAFGESNYTPQCHDNGKRIGHTNQRTQAWGLYQLSDEQFAACGSGTICDPQSNTDAFVNIILSVCRRDGSSLDQVLSKTFGAYHNDPAKYEICRSKRITWSKSRQDTYDFMAMIKCGSCQRYHCR